MNKFSKYRYLQFSVKAMATIGWTAPDNFQPLLDGTTTIRRLTLGSNPVTLTIANGAIKC